MRKRKLLEQYDDLIKERDDIKRRIVRIESQIQRILQEGNVKDHVKGGAGGQQTYYIDGFPTAEYDEKIYLLNKHKRKLNERNAMVDELVIEVEELIKSIDDSRMRRIVTFRCIDQMSWCRVAQRIGGKATEESVRKEYARFVTRI